MTSRQTVNEQPGARDARPCDSATTGQLARLADLEAAGRMPFPTDWVPDQQAELAAAVRSRRRDRLLRLIARLIADDLLRPGRPER